MILKAIFKFFWNRFSIIKNRMISFLLIDFKYRWPVLYYQICMFLFLCPRHAVLNKLFNLWVYDVSEFGLNDLLSLSINIFANNHTYIILTAKMHKNLLSQQLTFHWNNNCHSTKQKFLLIVLSHDIWDLQTLLLHKIMCLFLSIQFLFNSNSANWIQWHYEKNR